MATLKSRLQRIEKERKFQIWLRHERFLEVFTEEQLQFYAVTGWTEVPEPPGTSRLDKLNGKDLIKMWEESERVFAGRTNEQLGFFADHGHWPEDKCSERNCSKNEFDELKKKFSTQIKHVNI